MAQWQKLERDMRKNRKKKNSPLKTTGRCAQSESTTAAKAHTERREEKKSIRDWLPIIAKSIRLSPTIVRQNARVIYRSTRRTQCNI